MGRNEESRRHDTLSINTISSLSRLVWLLISRAFGFVWNFIHQREEKTNLFVIMFSGFLAILYILLSSLSIQGSLGARNPHDYLVLDGAGYEQALVRLRKGLQENGGDSVEEIADYFRKAREGIGKETGDWKMKQVLEFFVEMADSKPDSGACNSKGIMIFIGIVVNTFGSVENFAEMVNNKEKKHQQVT